MEQASVSIMMIIVDLVPFLPSQKMMKNAEEMVVHVCIGCNRSIIFDIDLFVGEK